MKKVMIVDDEDDIRQMLGKIVKRQGFEVVTCGDGITAVDMFKKEKPDLTFLDLYIPELRGWEVLQEIRKINPAAKVYFVTGSRDDVEELKVKNYPVDGFLLKPVDINDFVHILEENK